MQLLYIMVRKTLSCHRSWLPSDNVKWQYQVFTPPFFMFSCFTILTNMGLLTASKCSCCTMRTNITKGLWSVTQKYRSSCQSNNALSTVQSIMTKWANLARACVINHKMSNGAFFKEGAEYCMSPNFLHSCIIFSMDSSEILSLSAVNSSTFRIITLCEGWGYDKHLPFMLLLYLWMASISAFPFHTEQDGGRERGTEETAI